MHYLEANNNESTNETWFSIHKPNGGIIGTSEELITAQAAVNYLNGGNPPKPFVCIRGKRINLERVVGYEQDGNEIAFFLHGAHDMHGSNPEIILYFDNRIQAGDSMKWLDSILNVVEYKPETLQNRE